MTKQKYILLYKWRDIGWGVKGEEGERGGEIGRAHV